MHSFSFGELALIFGIIIILFGGSRIASIGKSLGEGIANFKKGLNSSPTSVSDEAAPASSPLVHAASRAELPTASARGHVVDVDSKENSTLTSSAPLPKG
jgi:TatA/E family protein of Tat protein translocase